MAQCNAKSKQSGERCKRAAARGKSVCSIHGARSTGPKDAAGNTNAVKHGFYSDALQPEERILWERVTPGSIDDEIRLMRVKLHRLVKLSGSADVADLIDSALEVAQKRDTHPKIGEFEKSEIKVKAPQYADLILAAVGEIRKLELQRLQMKLIEKQIDAEGDAEKNADIAGFEVVPYDEDPAS